MINSWMDPQGWPWAFFSGKIDTGEHINRVYPGFNQFRNLEVFQKGWPQVWIPILKPLDISRSDHWKLTYGKCPFMALLTGGNGSSTLGQRGANTG